MAAMVSCARKTISSFQPLYITSFGERSDKEPFDEEKTGWGWRIVTKLDAANTVLPTTCKMDRPS